MDKMGNHPNIKIALGVSLILMIARLLAFALALDSQYLDTAFLFVFLAGLIPLSLYAIWPRSKDWVFYGDLMKSLRITILYGVLISVFLFVFYSFIDTSYFPKTRAEIIEAQLSQATDADPTEVKRNIENFFSVRNFSVLILVLFLVLAVFYSILFSALKRIMLKGLR